MDNFAIAYICIQVVAALFVANAHGKLRVGRENFWLAIICGIPAWVCLYFGGVFK